MVQDSVAEKNTTYGHGAIQIDTTTRYRVSRRIHRMGSRTISLCGHVTTWCRDTAYCATLHFTLHTFTRCAGSHCLQNDHITPLRTAECRSCADYTLLLFALYSTAANEPEQDKGPNLDKSNVQIGSLVNGRSSKISTATLIGYRAGH